MKYDWVLFDADETLFHFDNFKGLQRMFSQRGVTFTQQDFDAYQAVNKPLWDDYQQGKINAAQLKHTRFKGWAQKLQTTTEELNHEFLNAMAEICTLLPGARELLDSLSGQARMGIITNGFTELQSVRLQKTGLLPYFEHVVISEQVGIAKPDNGIFSHAHNMMGKPDKQRVLMVGDNLYSDILGGVNFGIETCWLNRHGAQGDSQIQPDFTVTSLHELQTILLA